MLSNRKYTCNTHMCAKVVDQMGVLGSVLNATALRRTEPNSSGPTSVNVRPTVQSNNKKQNKYSTATSTKPNYTPWFGVRLAVSRQERGAHDMLAVESNRSHVCSCMLYRHGQN